ncbi:hypothetical protein TWF718_004438 [Orbilia javanica]|uniref:Uncharacterized protein n=1 Tax=Orbilia javanica TaxID=47235 RepID=A0AAN8MS98_9PEZI
MYDTCALNENNPSEFIVYGLFQCQPNRCPATASCMQLLELEKLAQMRQLSAGQYLQLEGWLKTSGSSVHSTTCNTCAGVMRVMSVHAARNLSQGNGNFRGDDELSADDIDTIA